MPLFFFTCVLAEPKSWRPLSDTGRAAFDDSDCKLSELVAFSEGPSTAWATWQRYTAEASSLHSGAFKLCISCNALSALASAGASTSLARCGCVCWSSLVRASVGVSKAHMPFRRCECPSSTAGCVRGQHHKRPCLIMGKPKLATNFLCSPKLKSYATSLLPAAPPK